MRIAFVMPAYNEEDFLEESLDSVLPYMERIVVVNDGSKDSTGALAEAYAARYPDKVEVIHHPKNRGIGGAVTTGIKHLLLRDDVDAIGIVASDNQCEPLMIPRFREVLEQNPEIDIAKGSRFLHPESLDAIPRFRYYGNIGVSAVMRLILGYWGMSDVLHGYLLARTHVFREMDLGRVADGYDLEITMMTEFRRLRCKVGLLPSPSHYGVEKSKIVAHKEIPRFLARMGHILGRRLVSGELTDRISPALLATGNVPLAVLAMWLTSPDVRVFPGPAGPIAPRNQTPRERKKARSVAGSAKPN